MNGKMTQRSTKVLAQYITNDPQRKMSGAVYITQCGKDYNKKYSVLIQVTKWKCLEVNTGL